MGALTRTPLCPSHIQLELDQIAVVAEDELIVAQRARRHVVACPIRRDASTRVHSRYQRTPADVPWHRLEVRLTIPVPPSPVYAGCTRRIFAERLSER